MKVEDLLHRGLFVRHDYLELESVSENVNDFETPRVHI
jgi:hypothetical protein